MRKITRLTYFALLLFASVALISAQGATRAASPSATGAVAAGSSAAVDESALTIRDAATGAPAAGGSGTSSIFPYFIRMILVLGLVIAAIYGLYALLKRYAKPKAASDSYLKVLVTTPVASGRSLHVISLGNKAWLVGSTDSSISLISEIEDKELIDTLVLRAVESPEAPRKNFIAMLTGLLGTNGATRPATPASGDFLSKQRDRLKKF